MRVNRSAAIAGVLLVTLAAASCTDGGEGTAERVGERVGSALDRAGEQLKEGWDRVRNEVERMGVAGRVYARLRWDKGIQGASVNVDVVDDGTATLRGTVPTADAQRKAVELTRDTVGVERVVDELTIAPADTR